eukprot:gene12686-17009_t
MVCCLLCFDDSPIPQDPKGFRRNQFQLSMMDTLSSNQPACCLSYFLPCCASYYIRYKTLDGDMTRYTCCQGYMDNICFRSGSCGERSCPEFCLGVESFCCLGPSVSATRMMVMDQYDLRPDPCDNRLVRLLNCLMIMSCICDIASIFVRELRDFAHLLHTIANMMFYCLIGCMVSQVHNEVNYRQNNATHYTNLTVTEEADVYSNPIIGHATVFKDEKF